MCVAEYWWLSVGKKKIEFVTQFFTSGSLSS